MNPFVSYDPPPYVILPESETSQGERFSRYGNTGSGDHNPTELRFSEDGKTLLSDSPGPGASNERVAGPFRVKEYDETMII